MKKILLIAALLIGTFSYSQVMLNKATKYLGITTTVRNTITINANEFPVIYNTTTGQFERYNGSTWERWTAGVTSADIADGALGMVDIADGAYGSITISSGVVDLGTNSVDNDALGVGAVLAANINTSAVTTTEILDGTIDELDLDASVNASLDLADSSIQSADVLATTDQTIPALTIRDIDLGGNTASTSLVISEGVNSLFQVNGDGTANFQQSSPTVADDAYGVGWNGDFKVPTKNAVYDKIETLGAGGGDDVSTFSEKTGALVGTDRLVGLSGATDFSETISGIPLSIFNDDLTHTTDTNLDIDTSAKLAAIVGDETGTSLLVYNTSPTLVTPALGTPSALVGTNITGTAASLTAGVATTANALESATTTVSVSAATAPTTGQVLKATSSTTATWQADDGGTPEDTAYGVGWDADTDAASKNTIYDEMETRVDSDVTGVTGADAIDNIMSLTQAEYDAITPDADTFYVITDATTQLTDLSDVNTATITNRNFLIADGVDWESRAATVADVSDLDADASTLTIGASATVTGSNTGDQNLADTVAEITDLDNDAATLTIGASATVTGSNTGDSQTLAAGVSDVTATASEINTPLDGASVTLTEFQELETIGATVISAADWTAVSNLSGTNTGDQTIEYKFIVPLGGSGADLAVADDVTHVPVLDAITITRVEADVLTAPTGTGITLDIELDDGTPASILSTLITIDATERFTSTAATAAVVSDATIPADSFLTFNVDVIGSTIAGAGGTVTIYYTID